jgi:hypothetical protein
MIDMNLHKKLQQLINYFVPKRIVYATGYPKGILLKASEVNGKKYLTIAVTNLRGGHAYIHHIPVNKVIGIQRAITPFQRWWYGKVVHKPLPNYKLKLVKK